MADHKDIENAQSSGQEENFKARRRLLKASAVVPLIGTLSPGAALAAASTQCDMAANTFPPAVVADDNALRVNAVFWESKSGSGHMYQVQGRYYDEMSGQEVYPTPNSRGRIRGYKAGVPKYVLAYVDVGRDTSTGDVTHGVKVTGFFPQQNSFGTAMTESCWASMGGLQSHISDQING